MLKLVAPLFFRRISSLTCENFDMAFPKGIENPDSGHNLGLSNLASDGLFLYSGGSFDS